MHCRFTPNQGRTTLCCLCVASSFAVLPGVLICSYEGVNCLNSVPFIHSQFFINLFVLQGDQPRSVHHHHFPLPVRHHVWWSGPRGHHCPVWGLDGLEGEAALGQENWQRNMEYLFRGQVGKTTFIFLGSRKKTHLEKNSVGKKHTGKKRRYNYINGS